MSDLLVMVHALDPDRYIVLRAEDIHGYCVIDDNEFFFNRSLQLKGIKPVPQPEIDLSSFQRCSLLLTLVFLLSAFSGR
jgi:hypothetical protein